jgi:hypothetical protein
MKGLVTQYHALNIKELARGGWLHPFSRYDWVWRTNKGDHQTTVTITVFSDALQLVFTMYGVADVHQKVQLTYSIGPQGGKRPWFVCPTCRRRVGVLYHTNGLPFRCRTGCKLAYPSQYRSRDRSYGRQPRMVSHREQDRLSAQCAVWA